MYYKQILIVWASLWITSACNGQKDLTELRREIRSTPSTYPQDSVKPPHSDTVKYFSAAYGYEYTSSDQVETYNYEVIRGFENLKYLETGFLKGDPSMICSYANLLYLHILDTNFCYLPCFSKLSSLRELYFNLGRNCEFPDFVFENSNLLSLSFDLKRNEQLPEISDLDKLKILEELSIDLSSLDAQEDLTAFLSGLSDLDALQSLTISLPQTFQQLPKGFGELKKLTTLSLEGDIISNPRNLEAISRIGTLDTLRYYGFIDVDMIDSRFEGLSSLDYIYINDTDSENYREVRDRLKAYLPNTTVEVSKKRSY